MDKTYFPDGFHSAIVWPSDSKREESGSQLRLKDQLKRLNAAYAKDAKVAYDMGVCTKLAREFNSDATADDISKWLLRCRFGRELSWPLREANIEFKGSDDDSSDESDHAENEARDRQLRQFKAELARTADQLGVKLSPQLKHDDEQKTRFSTLKVTEEKDIDVFRDTVPIQATKHSSAEHSINMLDEISALCSMSRDYTQLELMKCEMKIFEERKRFMEQEIHLGFCAPFKESQTTSDREESRLELEHKHKRRALKRFVEKRPWIWLSPRTERSFAVRMFLLCREEKVVEAMALVGKSHEG